MISNRSRPGKRVADVRKPLPSIIDPMAAPAVPRQLFGQVLALMGLDGGNDRALANAEGILGGLHRAREQVDALEVRIAHVVPARRRVGWPVSPRTGQSPRLPRSASAWRAWGREESNPRPTDYESASRRPVASGLVPCSPVDQRFSVPKPTRRNVLSGLVASRSFASRLQIARRSRGGARVRDAARAYFAGRSRRIASTTRSA
jgi:hypothetical protein